MTDKANTSPPIHLTSVHKTYVMGERRVHALRGIDLTLDSPGFYGIMGPSGSGKSTLLHLMAALDRPDSGRIEVAGCSLDEMSEAQLTDFRRRRIGIVFQQFNLIPTLTALDNVALPAMLDGMPLKQRSQRAAELLQLLGLGERMTHRPDALSGGEQQRVAIARALVFEPRVLFADEPTGNLDSRTSEDVWTLLSELAAQYNLTVVMVTHEPVAAAHCRSIILLRDGRILNQVDTHGTDSAELATRLQLSFRS